MNHQQKQEETSGKVKGRKFSKKKFDLVDDYKLKELVAFYGTCDWDTIAQNMKNRNARQCRERWEYYLSPMVNNGPWTEDEDKLLFQKYSELGSKWKEIAAFFHNRTNTNVKNRWLVLQREANKASKLQQFIEKENPANQFPMLEDINSFETYPDYFNMKVDTFDIVSNMDHEWQNL